MRAGTAPSAEFPAWWDAQIETLLNGDEDRRSREIRDARRAKRARIRRMLIWAALVVAVVAIVAMSVASGMLQDVTASLGGLLTDYRTRIGLS